MADRKISALAQLATPDDTDYLPIVDVSEPAEADKNKRVLWSRILPRSGGNVTGNITADAGVLIDGRDLSVDGTKLDLVTVTQAVDLDTIESRVNELDAAVVLKGSWDASVGTFPGGGTAQAGESYIVSVGGTVDGIEFTANDRIVAIVDNASTGTYAANWLKLDYTDQVLSVAGLTGAISASGLRTAINVEDGATADQTDGEIATAYQTAVPLISQGDAETGTATAIESWSALRVKQAIDALGGGGGGAFSADAQTQITPSTPIVLDEATGDEVALDLSVTVNKATSGNYTLVRYYATETAAPGTNNLLLDLGVGSTPKTRVTNNGDIESYNAFTDEANYERGFARWDAGFFRVGTEKAGTGTARTTEITSAAGLFLRTAAANEYRFHIGSAIQWRLTTGVFYPHTDVLQDIGASSNRVRDFYVGRNVFFDGLPTADPASAGQLWNNSGVLTVSAG